MYKCHLLRTIRNIDKSICGKIQLRKSINNTNIRYPQTSTTLQPKMDFNLLNKKNIHVRDFLDIKDYLQWNKPTHLAICDKKYILNNMKTAIIVGEKGYGSLIHHDAIEVGYAYFRPHWNYPNHYHCSPELYYILYGDAMFGKGNPSKFKQVRESDFVYHEPDEPHTMIFQNSPILSIYIWYKKGGI